MPEIYNQCHLSFCGVELHPKSEKSEAEHEVDDEYVKELFLQVACEEATKDFDEISCTGLSKEQAKKLLEDNIEKDLRYCKYELCGAVLLPDTAAVDKLLAEAGYPGSAQMMSINFILLIFALLFRFIFR